MNARSRQFGSTTTLVALAVVVSVGSVTDVQAAVALAQWRPEVRAQVASERDAVVQLLCEAVRLIQLDGVPLTAALPPQPMPCFNLVAVIRVAFPLDQAVPPPPRPAFHLIDMPPPAHVA